MTRRPGWIRLPDGWTRERRRGPWPFVTAEHLRRPDGTIIRWASREARKVDGPDAGSTWWAPRARGWWIGVLFAIGSACFALGAMPWYVDAVGVTIANTTFFLGSLFFTSAAFLQYREATDAADRLHEEVTGRRSARWRVLAWAPERIDWWATSIQFIGTLFFNVTTFAALRSGLDVQQETRRVWVPDLFGSIAFLVASALAWAEAGHAWLSWRPHSAGWRIAGINLWGSIAFGVSAVGAYIVPTTGELANASVAAAGTFLGALCFFAGGLMLLPERTAAKSGPDDT